MRGSGGIRSLRSSWPSFRMSNSRSWWVWSSQQFMAVGMKWRRLAVGMRQEISMVVFVVLAGGALGPPRCPLFHRGSMGRGRSGRGLDKDDRAWVRLPGESVCSVDVIDLQVDGL